MALNLIILGPPGAGKGTQAERFAKLQRIPKISTGDILREAVKAGTEIGQKVKAVMEAGELVSDDLIIRIVEDRLNRDDARGGFILDGFPRTVAQAKALDAVLAGRAPLIVIDIAVPEAELIRRLGSRLTCVSCGLPATTASDRCSRCGGGLGQRADDDESVVRERLKVYHRNTAPLVEYYRGRSTFRAVDGAQPPDVVAEALAGAVESAKGMLVRGSAL